MSAAVVCELCGEAVHAEREETLDALAFSAGFEGERCAECAAIQDEVAASSRRSEVLSQRDAAA